MKQCVFSSFFVLLFFLVGCGPDVAKYDAYVLDGQASLRTGDWRTASKNLKNAVRLNPSDGRLQYNLGMAALRCGQFHASARALQSAASLLQGDEAVDALLALARVRSDQRRWADADSALEAARECASESRMVDVLAAQSGLRYLQKNFEASRTLAAEALNIRPDHPVALYNLGCVLLYHDSDLPAARRAFDRYYSVLGNVSDPESSSILDPRGDVLRGVSPGPRASTAERIQRSHEVTNPGEACELARAAILADPLDGEAWRNYADKCLQTGNPDQAVRAYHRFARLSPNSPSMALVPESCRPGSPALYLEKANIALNSGNLAAAEQQYILALQADPESVEASIGMETVCWKKQNMAGALTYAMRADALRPNQPELLFRIACYLAPHPEQQQEAIRYYRRFLQYGDPESAQAESVRTWLRSVETAASSQP